MHVFWKDVQPGNSVYLRKHALSALIMVKVPMKNLRRRVNGKGDARQQCDLHYSDLDCVHFLSKFKSTSSVTCAQNMRGTKQYRRRRDFPNSIHTLVGAVRSVEGGKETVMSHCRSRIISTLAMMRVEETPSNCGLSQRKSIALKVSHLRINLAAGWELIMVFSCGSERSLTPVVIVSLHAVFRDEGCSQVCGDFTQRD
jgi:hypothetical protein